MNGKQIWGLAVVIILLIILVVLVVVGISVAIGLWRSRITAGHGKWSDEGYSGDDNTLIEDVVGNGLETGG